MKIAEFIAGQLFNAGVRKIYGIPGGPSIPYMEAFRDAGIEFILTANEAAAGIMADVSARLTGIPGVCHSTFGPGATNISTAAGGALLDRSSVLVLTSEIEDSMIGRTTQMNIDHQLLFKPVTKATFRLNPRNVREVIEQSLKICSEEYPGPVHIGLPTEIAAMEVGDSEGVASESPVTFHSNDLQRIISILKRSRRPLLAAGLTARRFGLGRQLISFLRTYRIPCVVTPMAKGLIPEEHPSYAGVLFHGLSDYLGDIYEKCDLVIGLGYDPVEYNYESWMPDIPLVHFNSIETDLPSGADRVQYVGRHEEWFEVLKNLDPGSLISMHQVIEGVRNEMISVLNGFSGHFGPVAAMKILHDELPADSVITFDVGSHLHLAGQLWDTGGSQEIIMTNGWSGMGFGIPAALSAQICKPGTTVACITGDGGFLMMSGELVTARRYNLPVIIIVFSDGELNLIKLKQSWKELPPYGTLLYQGDLFGSDTFLGVKVLKADSPESMSRAVNTALSLNEPVIINAVIDPDDYKWVVVKR